MELSISQCWLLLLLPVLCLSAVVLLWIGIQFTFGNFTWLFPVSDGPIPPQNEPVMTPGMTITTRTPDAIENCNFAYKLSSGDPSVSAVVEEIEQGRRYEEHH